jgi:phosphoribosylformimino-5-aminoimidazole carboxamide ribotide isomerase
VRLYPAVDILGGCAVRLTQGDYSAKTVYDEDPLSAARAWVTQGARHLHVVDLDGARDGEPVNLAHLRRITGGLDVEVQYGGGLRSLQAMRDALAAGAARVVLGTVALRRPDLLAEAIGALGADQVAVSIDIRAGRAATSGWTQVSELSALDALRALQERGAQRFIYTNVEHDGMLDGPDAKEVGTVAGALGQAGELIYSGGIGELGHLQALASLGEPRLAGVIVGTALYERRFTVAQAQAALAA